jgi:hypothetical protein
MIRRSVLSATGTGRLSSNGGIDGCPVDKAKIQGAVPKAMTSKIIRVFVDQTKISHMGPASLLFGEDSSDLLMCQSITSNQGRADTARPSESAQRFL